jgi:dephospho-CoA kinase
MARMSEIVFLVEDEPDGGLTARALGASIFTDADDLEGLKEAVRDAVRCHFDDQAARPTVIRLHWIREEVIAA